MTPHRATDPPAAATPARVLLVDDNAPYARLVALLLEEALGAAVVTEHLGRLDAALEHVRAGGADAVVLDLSLPDARGVEAVEQLQAAGARIVVLSGRDDPDLVAELARRGITFVRKGEERERLGPAVSRALAG